MLAAGWFVYTPERCLFLVCASTSEGKRNQAMYLLVDHVIRSKSGSGLIFDFTGSNIPGVAYFNSGFGAVKSYYPTVKRNNLPWPVLVCLKGRSTGPFGTALKTLLPEPVLFYPLHLIPDESQEFPIG